MSLLSSTPPSGHGTYGRGQSIEVLSQFDFVVLNALRSDTTAKAVALKRTNTDVWLFSGPSSWQPHVWQGTIARVTAKVAEVSAEGFIADPETGWPGLSVSDRRALARALGIELKRRTADMRVGMTSYPAWTGKRALADGADGRIFSSPQLYGKTAYYNNTGALRSWYGDWENIFGRGKVIPSASLWVSDPRMNNTAAYQAYLADLPRAAGMIGWPTVRGGPEWMRDAYLANQPGGSFLGGLALRVGDLIGSAPFLLLGLAAALIVAAMVFL